MRKQHNEGNSNAYFSIGVALLSLWAALACAEQTVVKSPFKIILDGGSTGSRLHVFEFVGRTSEGDTSTVSEADENDVNCVRRGSSRADIPLSAFGRLGEDADKELNATYVAEHLIPLFEYAAEIIPPEHYSTTPVKYQATAGMRLLEDSEQEAVYDALYEGLKASPKFVFDDLKRDDIQTLSGELEGFYGAVAANYLQGVVDAQLRFQQQGEESSVGPVGALDMGGSSTQIVFLPDGQSRHGAPETCSSSWCQTSRYEVDESMASQLNGDHFFSTSYLSYGVDQFRERLWTTLVQEQKKKDAQDPESCGSKLVLNPCANKGYQIDWEGFTLFGSGDTDECIRQTQRLIPHPELPHDDFYHDERNTMSKKRVGGVEHPPVRGKFLAMSLYFFSLDSLRVFSKPDEGAHQALNDSWPNPSIQELHDALDGLCSREWHSDMALQEGAHDFTRAEVLPHRCVETVYMVTLLKDGFGFHPESRDITFTFLVEGSEVEWTLGMALSMNADETSIDNSTKVAELPDINVTFEEAEDSDKAFRFQSTAHPLFLVDSL